MSQPDESNLVDLAVIAVNYNSAPATSRLLADLMKQDRSYCRLRVVIADNSPSDSELASVRESYRGNPLVRFERMPKNLGYFGAAHFVLRSVFSSAMPDWIVVANVDIRLPDPTLLSSIVKLRSGAGVIAPRIISGQTGLDQNPFRRRRPTGSRMALNRIIPRIWALDQLLHLQYRAKAALRGRLHSEKRYIPIAAESIYAPHGAFIIFNKNYFARGGSLNCEAFLFAEEIFIAEICRRIGVDVEYLPSLTVLHDEHVATSGNPSIRRFQTEAADYCLREFFAKASR